MNSNAPDRSPPPHAPAHAHGPQGGDAATATVPATRVLIAAGNTAFAPAVAYLHGCGLQAEVAGSGEQVLARVAGLAARPGVVVIDAQLPDMTGLALCQAIRALPGVARHTPVIMISRFGEVLDRILALELGADDFLTRPFEPRELLARMRSVLRRSAGEPAAPDDIAHFGSLTLNRSQRIACLHGRPVALTPYRFGLLAALADRAGKVVARDQLLALAPRQGAEPVRAIDVQIGRIRAVIETDVKSPRRILTVRGEGYLFAKVQE